jgi:hypothetical protein
MACEESLVCEGWFEREFRDSPEGAQAANNWYQEKNAWIRKTFAGLCERGCAERFSIKSRAAALPESAPVGAGRRFTMRIEFRVTCDEP